MTSPSSLEPHTYINMDCESSLDIGVIDFSLPKAYRFLEITDTSISDAAVVALFHKEYRGRPPSMQHWCIKALALISRHRDSSLLAFILTIVPHLTEENVSILAAQPSQPSPTKTAVDQISHEDEQPNKVSEPIVAPSTVTAVPSPLPTASTATTVESSPSSSKSTPNTASNSEDMYSSPDENASFASGKTASTGFDVSSGGDASTESDFSAPVGGKYWDGENWRCEECNEGLVEGNCPHGDTINPCRVCGRDLRSASCSMFCDECHNRLEGPCSECARGGDQHDEESAAGKMAWDENDGVWRCTTCLWEVEANSKKEGQCHCQVDPDVPWSSVVRIKLLYYHDYEPADSDSSGPESIDSEPNSEDRAFIEDDGPFDPGLLTLLGPIFPPEEPQQLEELPAEKTEGSLPESPPESHQPQSMDIS